MSHESARLTRCLTHQLLEDQVSAVGLVCPLCKQTLYTDPPRGRCLSFWESQPAASSTEHEPCFVYTLMWDDFRIRSLHAPNSLDDPRGRRIREAASAAHASGDMPERPWETRREDGFGNIRPPYTDPDAHDDLDFGGDAFHAE